PEISFDESRVDLGEVFISENPITSEYAINVKNDGLKELRISNIHLEHYDDIIIQYLYKHPFFGTAWKTIGGILNPSYSILPEGILENELRLVFTPTDSKYLNTPYRNKVIFKTNYGTYSANLNIVANYSLPPVFTVMTDSIYHIVNSNDTIADKVVLGNIEGQANLKYSVSLDYQRVSSVSSSLSTAVNNSVLSSVGIDEEKVALQNVNDEEFYRVLSYENNLAADSRLGFNGLYIFSAGTAFTAPEEGFKLSHVQTWYVPDTMLDSDIDIEIRAGADIQTAAIIHTQTVQHSITETDGAGSLLTYELDKEITLLPYERFYVIFSYPIEVLYPQGFAQVDDSELTKTFYVYDGIDTWIDLSATSFNKAHYIIRAAQKDAENLQWIEIDEPIGVVAKGGTKDLTFKMFPKNVPSANNNVNLIISTNDPINISESVNVVLRINQGPEVVIEDEYSVREADTLNVVIPVVDIEGDEVASVKLAKDYGTASLSYANGEAKFNYIPTYDDQGVNIFEIETTDALGLTSIHLLNVDVENVNRAPVVIDDSNIIINSDSPEYKKDYTSIFQELDGQEMTFTAEIENEKIAELFISENGIVVKPIKTGFTRLNLTATDIDGASVSLVKVVIVNALLNEDEILSTKWGVNPNPVDDVLRIEFQGLIDSDVNIKIFTLDGVLVKYIEETENNNLIKTPINDLASGVYLLELSNSEGKSIKKMIKK
ncbi:MAG: T9SS type A sorting domain-containing protein, partial [Flavobacteriales bacterium]|nr:T9SS type A sorting domain-containing protein [Flavobacteriales bacterium]